MSESVVISHSQIRTQIATELAELRAINQSISDEERRRFADLAAVCSRCGKHHDIFREFAAPHIFGEGIDQFELAELEKLQRRMYCACGEKISVEPALRRGFGTTYDVRRELFDRCVNRLFQGSSLYEDQIKLLVRFIFRNEILKVRSD